MNSKRFTLFTVMLAMMALMAGAVVSAQDDDTTEDKRGKPGRGFRGHSEIILDATGLTGIELREALRDGETIAELITANGGDVDSVVTALVEEATTRINEHVEAGRLPQERADEILDGLEENITARLDGTFEPPVDGEGRPPHGRRGGRGFGFGNDNPDATEDATENDA